MANNANVGLIHTQQSKEKERERDRLERLSWTIGSQCIVFSSLQNGWFFAEIIKIHNDDEGEWLTVKYMNNNIITKEIQRFSKEILPVYYDKNIKPQYNKLINTDKNVVIRAMSDVLDEEEINQIVNRINTAKSQKAPKSAKASIFAKFGIKTGDYDIKQLFDAENIEKKGDCCLERVRCISLIYCSWIDIKNEERKDENEIDDIFDIINNSLSPQYTFAHFIKDYKFIMQNKQVLGFDDDEKNNNICDGDECFIGGRHERDRALLSKDLFFSAALNVFNDNNDVDASIKSMVSQQILDSCHSFLYHTLRINVSQIRSEMDKKMNENEITDMDELLQLCHDSVAVEFRKYLDLKKKDARYRINEERGKQFSKFVTKTINKKSATTESNEAVSGGFIDGLMDEMGKYRVNKAIMNDFYTYLMDEEWDSDAVIMDYTNIDIANDDLIKYALWQNNDSLIQQIYKILAKQYNSKCDMQIFEDYLTDFLNINSQYSSGIRFFYWTYYKHITDNENIVFKGKDGGNFTESNIGYRICDWYISAKYASFKAEILENGFSLEQWMETKEKATMKYQVWKEDEEEITCEWQSEYVFNTWLPLYGIKKGELIRMDHIMSILFYTNFSEQSFNFSASFRRNQWNESDVSFKKRHSCFANWARLLRETIECYGSNMYYSDVDIFYHGIGKEFIFEGTTFKIFGPLSTTAEFEVAHGRFAKDDGMVVDILNDKFGQSLWNCVFWSDYQEENERLFVGSLQWFYFKSIHDIPLKLDYEKLIRPISMLSVMICGYPFQQCAIKNCDVLCIAELIGLGLGSHSSSSQILSKIPIYMQRLFKNMINNVYNVEINMFWMDMHKEGASQSCYGYLLFKPLFISSECIMFSKILHLFKHKLEHIIVYNIKATRLGWDKSIELNSAFTSSTISAIKEINESGKLQSTFKEIIIINPRNNISKFINKNQSLYNKYGWTLKQKNYYHIKRNSNCKNTLFITPL